VYCREAESPLGGADSAVKPRNDGAAGKAAMAGGAAAAQ
jgi:hypothetical protein